MKTRTIIILALILLQHMLALAQQPVTLAQVFNKADIYPSAILKKYHLPADSSTYYFSYTPEAITCIRKKEYAIRSQFGDRIIEDAYADSTYKFKNKAWGNQLTTNSFTTDTATVHLRETVRTYYRKNLLTRMEVLNKNGVIYNYTNIRRKGKLVMIEKYDTVSGKPRRYETDTCTLSADATNLSFRCHYTFSDNKWQSSYTNYKIADSITYKTATNGDTVRTTVHLRKSNLEEILKSYYVYNDMLFYNIIYTTEREANYVTLSTDKTGNAQTENQFTFDSTGRATTIQVLKNHIPEYIVRFTYR